MSREVGRPSLLDEEKLQKGFSGHLGLTTRSAQCPQLILHEFQMSLCSLHSPMIKILKLLYHNIGEYSIYYVYRLSICIIRI